MGQLSAMSTVEPKAPPESPESPESAEPTPGRGRSAGPADSPRAPAHAGRERSPSSRMSSSRAEAAAC